MKLLGTISDKDDQHDYIDAEGTTYELARENLFALVPETHKLIAIRTEQ